MDSAREAYATVIKMQLLSIQAQIVRSQLVQLQAAIIMLLQVHAWLLVQADITLTLNLNPVFNVQVGVYNAEINPQFAPHVPQLQQTLNIFTQQVIDA